MAEPDSVTVVIPQHNRADLLEKLLKQLASQTHRICRTVVVDNASVDNSVTVARAGGAEVIPLAENVGFAPAVNRGIAGANTTWVAILNNDVELPPDWLERLLGAAAASGAWFACGKLLRSGSPETLDGTFDLLSAGGTAWRCGHGLPDGPLWSERRPIWFAPLTAALFRRDLFDRTGLLDERFGSYLEDVDLGIRCAANGFTGVYEPGAVAHHQGSATRGAWHKTTVRQLARNQLLIVAKHFRGMPLWPAVVAQLLWGWVAVRHSSLLAFLQGKWEGLRAFAEVRAAEPARPGVRAVVEQSEALLYDLQKQAGMESYWRWYFMLTRGRRA